MSSRPPQLEHLEFLGDATMFAARIQALIPKCTLLENFSHAEVSSLADFMDVYRAEAGMEIIGEGQGGDFMLMLIEGKVEVFKRDRWNTPQLLATVEGGHTLGEMSMIDGEARFATCVAAGATLFAVLTREALARIIVEQPLLGAKILMELVLMLSQRLRATSERLLGLLDEKAEAGSVPHHLL
ncbi:MAG TPA: cyclic nucleotide-binding domain-containing protein [Burkholderiales bacterium]|jgi:CRP-like cAMP-binding protein|nr:cyclic nucleotide-binding domain-containing protein [Burkholderiales bacterium]